MDRSFPFLYSSFDFVSNQIPSKNRNFPLHQQNSISARLLNFGGSSSKERLESDKSSSSLQVNHNYSAEKFYNSYQVQKKNFTSHHNFFKSFETPKDNKMLNFPFRLEPICFQMNESNKNFKTLKQEEEKMSELSAGTSFGTEYSSYLTNELKWMVDFENSAENIKQANNLINSAIQKSQNITLDSSPEDVRILSKTYFQKSSAATENYSPIPKKFRSAKKFLIKKWRNIKGRKIFKTQSSRSLGKRSNKKKFQLSKVVEKFKFKNQKKGIVYPLNGNLLDGFHVVETCSESGPLLQMACVMHVQILVYHSALINKVYLNDNQVTCNFNSIEHQAVSICPIVTKKFKKINTKKCLENLKSKLKLINLKEPIGDCNPVVSTNLKAEKPPEEIIVKFPTPSNSSVALDNSENKCQKLSNFLANLFDKLLRKHYKDPENNTSEQKKIKKKQKKTVEKSKVRQEEINEIRKRLLICMEKLSDIETQFT